MIPRLENNPLVDESQKRLCDYVGKLFAEGEFADVIAFAQQELEAHPANLDMVVYRACSILILQVSGTVRKNDTLVEQAIRHLELIADLMRRAATGYDDSLNFYIALGNLVLEKFRKADFLIDSILEQFDEESEGLSYYYDRRAYWRAHGTFPPRHNEPQEYLPS